MPKITQIEYQQKNKNRCNLFIDGEFFVGLSLETVMKNRLKVGMEVDTQNLQNMISEDEKALALNKAVEYVSKTLKTKRQVKDYLISKGYSEDVVWHCIDKLKEYRYVDDKEYSRRFIESTSKNQGQRLVEYKLMMKGVKKEDISSAYDDTIVDANENARALAQKYLKNKERTKENISKAYRYLIGRGFSYEQASYAVKFFCEDD